jgi:hypothetical protein
MKLFKAASKIVEYFGTAASVYLELFWTVLLGVLGYLCVGLSSKSGFEASAKTFLLFHVWGLFYIVAKQPYARVKSWQRYRKLKNVDRIQELVEHLDTEEIAEQVQMMAKQLDRSARINLMQQLGQELIQQETK